MSNISQVRIAINSEDAASVEAYVRQCIEEADPEWSVETAEIETSDGVIVDLLDDVETDDEPDEDDDAAEATTQTIVEEESVDEETPSEDTVRSQPSGKEF